MVNEKSDHIDPLLTTLIYEYNKFYSIDVSKLDPGIKVIVKTKNSTYTIETTSDQEVWVQGGSIFPDRIKAFFNGSTFGGSCIKQYSICYMMNMEFSIYEDSKEDEIIVPQRWITTSILAATIVGSNWQYAMEWSK